MLHENELLSYVYRSNAALPASVTVAPGDDMGGLALGSAGVLVTVDQLIDGVHVDTATMPMALVGRKAITRNLSDVAAMAAVAVGAVVAVALPRGWEMARAKGLFDAMRETAERYGCPLFGGDISVWDGALVVSVTVLAEAGPGGVMRRDGSAAGDGVYVTGALGNSFASGHHLTFEPRMSVARALASSPAVGLRAMMDLSDGLAMDLPRMVEHAEVWAERLPVRTGTAEPTWRHAVGDGEDYELLFTAHGEVPRSIEGVPITRIGTVTDAGGVRIVLQDGSAQPMTGLGWEHGR